MRLPRPKSRRAAVRALVLAAVVSAVIPAGSQNREKEEQTQTLELPRELPLTVEGTMRRLTFHVTPLSEKGLLTQQVRDALKALSRQTNGETVLRIRAFVAGAGDARRVRDLVSETFSGKHQPLPALSLVQAGGLPLAGAQVVLEAEANGNKDVNPYGLAFISAQPAVSENLSDPIPPLAARTLASMKQALAEAGAEPADVAKLTCFLSSLDSLSSVRALVQAEYPKAAVNYVQPQRAPGRALAACEAVARLPRNPGARLRIVDGEAQPGDSAAALLAARRIVLTGSQVSFGYQERDARLALARLREALEHAGASMSDVAEARFYPLASGIVAGLRTVRPEFFGVRRPPAGLTLIFDGLPSMDAGFAVDAVAAKD